MRREDERDQESSEPDRSMDGTIRRWRKRERPEPSVVWQTVGILFVGLAATGATCALTLPGDAAIAPSELWIMTGALAVLAVTCFIAHWDVNRGRRAKEYETEDLPP
jgi:transposase InsO family protein